MASLEYSVFARIPKFDAATLCRVGRQLGSPLELIRLAKHVPADLARAAAPFAASPLEALGLPLRALEALRNFDQAQHDADREILQRQQITVIGADEADYPPQLRQIPGAPAVLFLLGNRTALHEPQLAMVGSRHPTANGARTARDLAFHFASHGLAITSGLAVGIDAASHGGALAAEGITIAVCATGLDRLYPEAHAGLAERIQARGALLSEFPPGTPPIARHFVQRNRLISGLSLGVLVVEAAARSGSLTTARHAGEQGREVFAVPGSIHSPQSRGCHQLLRQGAVLVENADDVLCEIKNPYSNQSFKSGPIVPQPPDEERGRLDNPAEILLDALGFESTSLDALVASTGLSSTSVASLLLVLEQDGRVASDSAGRYYRIPNLIE
ncbi:MAG: DNA-protecting protein DprA [Gammaproteobacteria bacterium]|nr:DNA-protecting protein DprA [Gammaproteobacteria bacterium]